MSAPAIGERWRLVSLGDGQHRLETNWGRTIAWVRGHAVGVDGFQSLADALAAALRLRLIVDDVLAREYPARHGAPRRPSALRLVHDGAYEWVAAGNVPVARVHPPRTIGLPNVSVALEFVLPSFVSETTALAVARAIARG